MKHVLVLAAALAACTPAPPAPPPPAPAWPAVPDNLRHCAATPAAAPVPKPPRTWDVVVAWGNQSDERRDETAHELDVCRAKLGALVRWIEDRKAGRDGEHEDRKAEYPGGSR